MKTLRIIRRLYSKKSPLASSCPLAIVLSSFLLLTATFAQTGTVLDQATNDPIQNAIVALKSTGALVLTDEEGKFEFSGASVTTRRVTASSTLPVTFRRNAVQFEITEPNTPVSIRLYTANGRMATEVTKGTFQPGTHTLPFSLSTTNLWIASITIGNKSIVTPILRHSFTPTLQHPITPTLQHPNTPTPRYSNTQNADTLTVSKYAYTPKTQPLSDDNTIKLTKPEEPPPPPGMKSIPGGTFMMGATNPNNFEQNEIPRHEVTLSPFFMDSTEVTQADYALLMGVEPWTEYVVENPLAKYPGKGNYLPTWFVTWDDAALYCNARSKRDGLDTVYTYDELIDGEFGSNSLLSNVEIEYTKNGYRMPTESEWEYAARAGTQMEYYWSNKANDTAKQYACFDTTGPLPVASLLPNDFGLYDMVGNVTEFANDYYGYYSEEDVVDPTGPESGTERCRRGGGEILIFHLPVELLAD